MPSSLPLGMKLHIIKSQHQHHGTMKYNPSNTAVSPLYLHKIILLNLVSAIFYQIFFFSSNDSPSKTIKNVFYFIERALFILDIFNFLRFFPFLSTHFRFKKTNRSGIIYDTNSLADVIFGISQKPLYITSSNLVR